jgi:hypothetical protein
MMSLIRLNVCQHCGVTAINIRKTGKRVSKAARDTDTAISAFIVSWDTILVHSVWTVYETLYWNTVGGVRGARGTEGTSNRIADALCKPAARITTITIKVDMQTVAVHANFDVISQSSERVRLGGNKVRSLVNGDVSGGNDWDNNGMSHVNDIHGTIRVGADNMLDPNVSIMINCNIVVADSSGKVNTVVLKHRSILD